MHPDYVVGTKGSTHLFTQCTLQPSTKVSMTFSTLYSQLFGKENPGLINEVQVQVYLLNMHCFVFVLKLEH